MCLLAGAIVITEPPGLLPVYKQHGFLLPFAVQPSNSLSLELPILPHTPLYQSAIDVCIDIVHAAARILSKIADPACHLFIEVFG